MSQPVSRREAIQSGAALASAVALGRFGWMLPVPSVQPGEEVVPWTDVPANFNPANALDTRALTRETFITPTSDFYLVQHYGPTVVDAADYRLRVTGLVKKPIELTLDELK